MYTVAAGTIGLIGYCVTLAILLIAGLIVGSVIATATRRQQRKFAQDWRDVRKELWKMELEFREMFGRPSGIEW